MSDPEMKLPLREMDTEKVEYIPLSFPTAFLYARGKEIALRGRVWF